MEGRKYKVLLCEDDTNLGMVLKNYLELNDYDVILERDGRLGLAAFQREKFDICLLDVMMPHMDGFKLLSSIFVDDDLHDLPIIVLTAKNNENDRKLALDLGAKAYFCKPYREQELVEKLHQVIS